MEWKPEYNVGIELIDQQHRKLGETISRLEACSSIDAQNREMRRALKFLVEYTHYHFSEEVSYMKEVGFPSLEHHKTLHEDQLITKADATEHKDRLFKQADLENLLKQMPEIENKLAYLKNIYENSFITPEVYGSYQSKLLQDI